MSRESKYHAYGSMRDRIAEKERKAEAQKQNQQQDDYYAWLMTGRKVG